MFDFGSLCPPNGQLSLSLAYSERREPAAFVTGQQVRAIVDFGLLLLTGGLVGSVIVLFILDYTLFRLFPWLGGRLGITILRYVRAEFDEAKLLAIKARFIEETTDKYSLFLLASRSLGVFSAQKRGVFWFSQSFHVRTELFYRGYLEASEGTLQIVIKLRHSNAAGLLLALAAVPMFLTMGFTGSGPQWPSFVLGALFSAPCAGSLVWVALRIRRDRDAFRWLIDRFIEREVKKLDRDRSSEHWGRRRPRLRKTGDR